MEEAKIEEIKVLWREEFDKWVLKAATEDLYEYPPEIQTVIQEEAVSRGLLEGSDIEPALSKVLRICKLNDISVEAQSGVRKGYFCPECNEIYLNPCETLCSNCNISLEGCGYCKECDRFWPIPPGELCQIDQKELVEKKQSMANKLGELLMSGISLILEFI